MLVTTAVLLGGCETAQQLSHTEQQPPSWSWPPIDRFMTASGTELQGGFKFMGVNLDPWRFIPEVGEIYSQDEISGWVANAVSYTHARVIRMHMNGGAFEPSVGQYGESAFKQLDCLLAAARQHNAYVLIALRDYAWTPWPPGRAYDPYWYMDGGTPANPGKDNVLTRPDAIAAFKRYIDYVVNRVNTVTGVKYKDDVNILGWEIMNEPKMIPGIESWFADIGSYIKSVDPHHLVGVAPGDLAEAGWEPGAARWDALKIPQLDFVAIHYYADFYNPQNTNWVSRYHQILQTVKTLDKPVILDEFGCPDNYAVSRIANLYRTLITSSFNEELCGVMQYSWGSPGPNQLGGPGSFCIDTRDADICSLLRSLAPR